MNVHQALGDIKVSEIKNVLVFLFLSQSNEEFSKYCFHFILNGISRKIICDLDLSIIMNGGCSEGTRAQGMRRHNIVHSIVI